MKKISRILISLFVFIISISTTFAATVNDEEYTKQNTGEEIIQKRIIVGDKRAIDLKDSVEDSEYDYWITSEDANLKWIKESAVPTIEKEFLNDKTKKNIRTAIVFVIGINDFKTEQAKNYYTYLNSLYKKWSKYTKYSLHFVSLTRIDEDTAVSMVNDDIVAFNKQMKKKLSKKIYYIDAYNKNVSEDREYNPWVNTEYSEDGLYYDQETNEAIYRYVMQEVYNTTESTGDSGEIYDPENPISNKTKVSLSTKKIKLGVGTKTKISVVYTNGQKGTSVVWSSNDKSIATVSKKGYVKGIKVGKTKIKATITFKDGSIKVLTCSVEVTKESMVTDIKFSNSKALTIKKSVTFNKKTVKTTKQERKDNPSLGKTKTVTQTVIKYTPTSINLKIKKNPVNAKDTITWSIDTTKKISINKSKCKNKSTCKLTAKEPGMVTITVKASSGVVQKFKLNVTTATVVKPSKEKKDRIHYIDVSQGAAKSGDGILYESQGKFGLIDAGTYHGGDATTVKYLLNNKVTHLEFVIVTHADGDHRGGIKQLLNTYVYLSKDDKKKDKRTYLVDERTVFIYKKTKDFEFDKSKNYQDNTNTYKTLMQLSKKDRNPYVVETISLIKENPTLERKGLRLQFKNMENPHNSYIYFVMGNMIFRTYNLENLLFYNTASSTNNENTRSLITYTSIKKSNATSEKDYWKVLSMGDANTLGGVEQYYGNLIGNSDRVKGHGIDVLKLGHHGYSGSNSREFLDIIKPDIAILSNGKNMADTKYSFQVPYYYLTQVLGTKIYQTGDYSKPNQKKATALKLEFTDKKIKVNTSEKKRTVTNLKNIDSGTYKWKEWRSESDSIITSIDNNNKEVTCMYLLRNNKMVKDEYAYAVKNDSTYYYDKNGRRMYTNSNLKGNYNFTNSKKLSVKMNCAYRWEKDSTGHYYVKCNNTYIKNKIVKINGKKYYFNVQGYMVTGWAKVKKKWYYFGTNGAMVTGWIKDGKNKYYLSPTNGAMLTGKQKINNKTYKFNSSGKCTSCK